MFSEIVEYFSENSAQYWQYVGERLALSFESLAIALIIALPLGYWGSKNKVVAATCQGFAQVLRIIPSLALLFILIPIIGVGRVLALIALIVLALPPLIVNTVLGFNEVPAATREVGQALGMNSVQLFARIEAPLSVPYILNGIKLALVEIISSATLATYIGAGGLGTLIFTGLGLYRMDLLVIGGASVALLSLLSMAIFDFLVKASRCVNGE